MNGGANGLSRDGPAAALFAGPFLLLYATILVWPLFNGIALSFHTADLFGFRQFVGGLNFRRLLTDAVFLQAVGNTLKLTALIVPPLTLIALGLALALNRPGRRYAVLRGVFFTSSVLSVTVVTLVWRFVLTPDAGLLAQLFRWLGLEPLPWLSAPGLTIPALAMATIWWSIGFPMILFLAGLQQIPPDMYEAAALDNASRWTVLRRITLPAMKRTVLLVLMVQTAAQLQIFGQAQLLTAGGPSGASRPVVLFIFEAAFGRWDLGYALAAAQLLFLVVLALTAGQYWLNRDRPLR